MPIEEADFQILALCAAELIFKVFHKLIGLGPDVAPEAGEVGQVE